MRVCTFNTYQATTMPFRHRRLPGLYPALLYLSHHRVDVLCLQEQNSTRFGPLSYLLWRLALLFPFISHSPAMELLEYLGVAEGFLLPLFVADNKRHILQYAQQHTRFAHSVTVPPPRYFFDNGLIILSAHPIDEASTTRIHLRRDAGNRPGLIATNISLTPPDPSHPPLRVRLYNVHFVPSLLDVNVVFRTLNAINGMLGRDTRELRKEHFAVLMDDIRKWQVKDEQLMFIVAGDFNVSRGTSEEEHFTKMMREQAGLHAATMRPLKATACERTFSHEGPAQRQADSRQCSAAAGACGWCATDGGLCCTVLCCLVSCGCVQARSTTSTWTAASWRAGPCTGTKQRLSLTATVTSTTARKVSSCSGITCGHSTRPRSCTRRVWRRCSPATTTRCCATCPSCPQRRAERSAYIRVCTQPHSQC